MLEFMTVVRNRYDQSLLPETSSIQEVHYLGGRGGGTPSLPVHIINKTVYHLIKTMTTCNSFEHERIPLK